MSGKNPSFFFDLRDLVFRPKKFSRLRCLFVIFFRDLFFIPKNFSLLALISFFFKTFFFLAPSKMLRLRRLSVTARPFGRNYGKFFEKKTLPMALRITSKDYENLYVTSYFSFHGDKNTLYVNSSKKYRPTSGKLCPRKKNIPPEKILWFLPEKSSLQPEKKNHFAPEKTSECPRKFVQKWARKINSPREKSWKNSEKMPSRALFIFSGKKKHWGYPLTFCSN